MVSVAEAAGYVFIRSISMFICDRLTPLRHKACSLNRQQSIDRGLIPEWKFMKDVTSVVDFCETSLCAIPSSNRARLGNA